MKRRYTALCALCFCLLLFAHAPANERINRFLGLTKKTAFTLVHKIECQFNTYHPQGLLKIGDHFIISSVQVLEPVQFYAQPDEQGYDRSTGRGLGHLFKVDAKGRLIKELELAEGDQYHPSGIDFDGRHIWVSLAEYRPNSRSTLFKVDMDFNQAEKMFTVQDHIGTLAYNRDSEQVYGFSWGSRRIYCWTTTGIELYRYSNPSHFLDYQDAKYLGRDLVLAGGLNKWLINGSGDPRTVDIGGLALFRPSDGKIIHEIPLNLRAPDGGTVTRNSMDIADENQSLQFYFAPEDNQTTIYVYRPAL
ncbi:hypothetical protein GX408_08780 [bacterium]|nr:hypothetical protein [bacterium]